MRYTNHMKNYIADNVKGCGNKELTDLFNAKFGTNISVQQMKSYKVRNKFSSGLTGWYEQGNKPHNKGKKGCAKGCEKSWFKKGNVPPQCRSVGSERITKDGYKEVKVTETKRWRMKHNIIWENANGRVPKNHVVIFLDGDKLNTSISNLKLISRRELLIMNRYGLFSSEADITDVASNLAKLIDIKNRTRKRVEGV